MKSVLQALNRVKNFAERPDIPANARATRIASEIGGLAAVMEAAAAKQVSGAASRRRGSKNKQGLADAILEAMRAINRTVKSLDTETHPSAKAQFPMPTSQSYQALLSSARAFLQAAAPIKEALVESAMPADFDSKLQGLIDDFTAATLKANSGYSSQMGGTGALLHAVRQGSALIRKLDAIMKNLLDGNAILLGIWKVASHIERPPRRKTPPSSSVSASASAPEVEVPDAPLPTFGQQGLPPSPPLSPNSAEPSLIASPVFEYSSEDRNKHDKPLPPSPFPELFSSLSTERIEAAVIPAEVPPMTSEELTLEPLKNPVPVVPVADVLPDGHLPIARPPLQPTPLKSVAPGKAPRRPRSSSGDSSQEMLFPD